MLNLQPTNQCRVAPSLGALEGEPNDVWGTTTYIDGLDRPEG